MHYSNQVFCVRFKWFGTLLIIKSKEEMGVANILKREHELNAIVFERLSKIENLSVLAPEHTDRLGVISFFIEGAHYNLIVKLLNDRFGIQTRGGCSCAGTYGHYLLNVDRSISKSIEMKILEGCLIDRPGWIRMSMHPTMTNAEITFICDAIESLAKHFHVWGKDYEYDSLKNEFVHKTKPHTEEAIIQDWFGE